eukprot:scaffold101093_cov27-Attheya_sp.AAC.3
MFDLTINKISDLRCANKANYYKEHPAKQAIEMNLAPSSTTKGVDIVTTPGARDITENHVAPLMGVDPLAQGHQSQHGGSTQKNSTEIEAQRGWGEAARALLKLEGTRMETHPNTAAVEIASPTITED